MQSWIYYIITKEHALIYWLLRGRMFVQSFDLTLLLQKGMSVRSFFLLHYNKGICQCSVWFTTFHERTHSPRSVLINEYYGEVCSCSLLINNYYYRKVCSCVLWFTYTTLLLGNMSLQSLIYYIMYRGNVHTVFNLPYYICPHAIFDLHILPITREFVHAVFDLHVLHYYRGACLCKLWFTSATFLQANMSLKNFDLHLLHYYRGTCTCKLWFTSTALLQGNISVQTSMYIYYIITGEHVSANFDLHLPHY